ncbi:CAAX prenyl protease-related protein [Pseudoduganella aquatica]|uniref:CAAX prenyl protease-related protein n=1 Tax=Pseudoduganella aquatica TaxID=2660641 RepID=A0A7X4HAU4_9BURK|nr:CAAX prenyl protease-related protein [Pseudoduganella aquatica]MYN07444.1 CAAX prenyl protease-related protein [Pseudoduganella aquatica]
MKPYLSTAEPAGSAPALARIVPFAVYLFFIFIADVLVRLGYSAQDTRWLYGAKILAVSAALMFYWRHYAELAWKGMRASLLAASVALGLLVFVLWISLDAGWMQIGSAAGFDPRGAGGAVNWGLVALRIAGAALVVPVMEELFWRSFLLRWLDSPDFLSVRAAAVSLKALAITVLLFGFEHNLWLAGMVAGLAYSLLYMRSGNLWAAIVAHGVTNGVLGAWIVATGNWHYW